MIIQKRIYHKFIALERNSWFNWGKFAHFDSGHLLNFDNWKDSRKRAGLKKQEKTAHAHATRRNARLYTMNNNLKHLIVRCFSSLRIFKPLSCVWASLITRYKQKFKRPYDSNDNRLMRFDECCCIWFTNSCQIINHYSRRPLLQHSTSWLMT